MFHPQSSGTAYHVADIVAELAGLVFIVGILKPEMPDLLPLEARARRGASRLLEDCSSESVLWNAKVQENSAVFEEKHAILVAVVFI